MSDKLLIEHEWYKFTVHKDIEFPDGTAMCVLIDPHGFKHLVNKTLYANYCFEVGQEINCRIDKINCSGRIFLEPEHPFYKEGNTYNFEVLDVKTIVNSRNITEQILVVADIYGNQSLVPIDMPVIVGDSIACIVETIKKGQLLLFARDSKHEIKGLKEGEWLDTTIAKAFTGSDKDEYFVLRDAKGNEFPLKSKYYENYKLSLGDSIKCKLVKIRSQWDYVLEPEHPYYKEGINYTFNIESKETIDNYQMGKDYFLISSDIYKLECKIPVTEAIYNSTNIDDSVECTLERVKKSKLILSYFQGK